MTNDGSPAPDNVVDLRDYDTPPVGGLNPVQFATANAPAPSVAPAPGRTLPAPPSYPPPPASRPTIGPTTPGAASASLGPQFKLQGAHAVAGSAKHAADAQAKAAATPKSLVRETHGWSHS